MLLFVRRSSIDPVATLSILSSVGVSQGDTLYTLIFGESLLNDGVSIVLFDSLVRHMGDAAVVDRATIQDTLYHFAVVSAGSIMIGILCGALCTLYFWALRGKQTAVSEVALFFTWALVPYYVSENIGCCTEFDLPLARDGVSNISFPLVRTDCRWSWLLRYHRYYGYGIHVGLLCCWRLSK